MKINYSIFLFLLVSFGSNVLAQAENKTDENGLKQGKWVLTGADLPDSGYDDDQKVEEGNFKDDKKNGLWIKYHKNGKVKGRISYVNNIPKGAYVTFYASGMPEEEGDWQITKHVGIFRRYHPNGKISQEFNFDPSGKRVGEQKYYHENGKLMIKGNWVNGQENGELIEFYEDGSVKAIKNFNNGDLSESNIQSFKPSEKKLPAPKVEIPTGAAFNGEGNNTKKDKAGRILEQGLYKNFQLINGKRFTYNANGELVRTAVYKNGEYAGDE